MKKLLILIAVLMTNNVLLAQNEATGSIGGKLTDKEMGSEPLPFANVSIKGTSKGTTTNIEGLYAITNLEPGSYTIVYSFVGYETLEIPDVEVVAGKVTEINTELGSSAASLDEVVITTVSRRDSEVALLLEQKAAVEIRESIGAQELAQIGVSDVATATTKISGVTSSEASGDIFIRGLGDRYLYTTLNGLPVPSDDVERKNIDLGLFSTSTIQSVGVSKTYSAENSADQASGTVNIVSRELAGPFELNLGVRAGINTNAAGQFDQFKVSPNQEDVSFGFYDQSVSTQDALIHQGWDPLTNSTPFNRRYALTAGKRFGENLEVLFTGSKSTRFEYQTGLFREYRENNLYDYFSDTENFSKTDNTTGLLDLGFDIDENHNLKVSSLFINKLTDEVFEAGRNSEGVVYEETDIHEDYNQFIRDQNIKQTRLWINQLHGNHTFSDWNELDWAVGYNMVTADEPNRIRNELNINGEVPVQLGQNGGYQQRKSLQEIDDSELNAFVKDRISIVQNEDLSKNTFLQVGGSYRNKERNFISQFFGIEESSYNSILPGSIDNLSDVFTPENDQEGKFQLHAQTDRYKAKLNSYGAFANFNLGLGKWNLNLGARYQQDELDIVFDVNNYPSTLDQFSYKTYNNVYPSLNLKFSPNEKSNFRLAASRTITLPEFKEIAPFEYVAQTGQVTRGNPDLEASRNLNLDLKYEFFPSSGQLVSLTGFYKKVKDPINKVQTRGASGVFSYFNAGNEANIYGLELEADLLLVENDNPDGFDLGLSFNASRMWHEQDLKEVYRGETFLRSFEYNNKKSIGLQGASDWIFNGALHISTDSENPFRASIVGNYASDKIYAIGSSNNQTQRDIFYNDEIIEKGFVTLDVILNQQLGEHWGLNFRGQNLLNPEIERIQAIRPSSTGIETNQTVRSYTRGAVITLGLNYSF